MALDAVAPVAHTTRNGVVESIHFGTVVCLDEGGDVAWSAGDPGAAVYARSSLKPLQATAMLAAGLPIEGEELAIACASHFGQAQHTAVVERLLRRFGLSPASLQNTADLPLDRACAAALIRDDLGPASIYQNCSGKHAAMLATCVVNGWPTESYLEFDHPLQRHITDHLAVAAGGVVHTGVDGCGAPTAMVSLTGLAGAFRDLAIRRSAAYVAMTSYPQLVAADAHEDTRLMRAVTGLVSKGGAEAVGVVATAGGRAIAVKIADGGERARLPVLLRALTSLGVEVAAGAVPVPPILGHGRPVGETIALVP